MDFLNAGCKIIHLHKDEMAHELAIRRLPVNPVSRRSSLCHALKQTADLAKKGSLKCQDLLISNEVAELELCQRKVEEIDLEAKGDLTASAIDRLSSRCKYLLCRVSRLPQETEAVLLLKTLITSLLDRLNEQGSSASSGSDDDFQSPNESRIVREIIYKTDKTFNINSLNLKFKGDTCVRTFLSRLEELRNARGISESRIYRGFPEVLEGPALSWFRSQRTKLTTYKEVTAALQEEFDIPDLDHQLLQEIRARTQAKSETIVFFVSTVLGMYERLTKEVPEQEKLDTMMRNIRPEYSKDLALHDIESIEQLKSLCKRIELAQVKAKQFREPILSNKTNDSSSDNPSKNVEPRNKSFQSRFPNSSRNFVASVAQSSSHTKCFRCGRSNHNTKECKSSRDIVCFKCGEKGVKTPECVKCNSKTKN